MDADLPKHINFWIKSTSKHDCFFNVGPESGQKVRIGAIKVLLISHSEVFQKMLDDSPMAEKEDISIIDSDPETFMNFLKCIYGGTDIVVRNLTYEKCMRLLYLCEKYLTIEIQENIISLILQLYQPLSIDHVIISLSHPACITNPSNRLTKAISKVIQNKTEQILNHKSFLNLDSNAIEFISKQDRISTEETNLWKAVFKWAQEKTGSKDPQAVRSHLGNILKLIRFCAMDANDFCTSVVPSEVLTMEEVFGINMSIGTKTPLKLDTLCREVLGRNQSPTLELSFTHVLYNVKNFSGSENSLKYKLGEFSWHIELKREYKQLSIFLYCSRANYQTVWKCKVKFAFELVNHINGKPNLTRRIQCHEYTHVQPAWGPSKFLSFEDLVDMKMGYIKNNSVEIVTTVEFI